MAETDERAVAGAAGAEGSARASGSTGEGAAGRRAEEESSPQGGDEAEEVRAEEESAKAMEAEVPHPPGYENPGQEPPPDAGQTS